MRNFLLVFVMFLISGCSSERGGTIMTVRGPLPVQEMGITLTHEHVLVDFIGADSISENRWDKSKAAEKILPYLIQIKNLGCKTLVECTPAFIGRDPVLLKRLSEASGLNILTNTGLYGAANDKFIPGYAYEESADQLADRWVDEYENGISGTGIKPGFIKIGVDTGSLSEIDRKLVEAAAKTHLKTGLTIASHTGPAVPAFEELDVLKKEGVAPEAFIWVHAQNEKDWSNHLKAAKMGAWISLDGVNGDNIEEYVRMISNLRDTGLLNKVLLSHDAGWYDPEKEDGGNYRGYSTIFDKLVPALKEAKYTDKEINLLLVVNPANAFTIRIRNL